MRKNWNATKTLSEGNHKEEATDRNVPVSIVGFGSLDEEHERC